MEHSVHLNVVLKPRNKKQKLSLTLMANKNIFTPVIKAHLLVITYEMTKKSGRWEERKGKEVKKEWEKKKERGQNVNITESEINTRIQDRSRNESKKE